MDTRRPAVRTAALLPVSILVACTEQDAEAAGEGFLNWILILLFIGMVAFVLWALILAGGIAALIAGWRRLNRPNQSSAPPPAQSAPHQTLAPPPLPGDAPERTGEPAPDLPPPPAGRNAADPVAILLIVFGVILVMSAGPIVLFGGNGDSRGWFDFSVPAPMLIVAGVLVWFGVSRSKKR